MAPDVAEPPAWMLTREASPDDEATASRFAVAYSRAMRDLETVEERRNFVHGAVRANNILRMPECPPGQLPWGLATDENWALDREQIPG